MSQCKPRLPPPRARIGVNRGLLVGVRIRKHSKRVGNLKLFGIYFSPRYGDCLEITNENLKLVKKYLPFQWHFSFPILLTVQLKAFNVFF